MDHWDQTHVVKLGDKHLYLLSHLAGLALLVMIREVIIAGSSLKAHSDFTVQVLPPAVSFRESATHFCINAPEQPKLTPEHTSEISVPRAKGRPIKPEMGDQIFMVLAESLGLTCYI